MGMVGQVNIYFDAFTTHKLFESVFSDILIPDIPHATWHNFFMHEALREICRLQRH